MNEIMIEKMLSWLPAMNAYNRAAVHAGYTDDGGGDQPINHDGLQAAISNLHYHPNNPELLEYAEWYRKAYIDFYVNAINPKGAVAGHLAFPEGLAKDWELNKNEKSRDALIAIRTEGAGMAAGSGVWVVGSREIAHALLCHIEADRVGLVPLDSIYFDKCVNWALGHIDQWLGDPNVWDQQYVEMGWKSGEAYTQAFMMGITGVALSKVDQYLNEKDPRILPALANLAIRLREMHWRPHMEDFIWAFYPDGHFSPKDEDGTTNILNMEVAPFFGYVYHKTGHPYFKTALEDAIAGATKVTGVYRPKQYNQQYRWFKDCQDWIENPVADKNDFYAVAPPFFPRAKVGESSAPINIMPMCPVTGVIHITDNKGWQTFVEWNDSDELKTFVYEPTTPGKNILQFSNNIGLNDAKDIEWEVTGSVIPIPSLDGLMILPHSNPLFLVKE